MKIRVIRVMKIRVRVIRVMKFRVMKFRVIRVTEIPNKTLNRYLIRLEHYLLLCM